MTLTYWPPYLGTWQELIAYELQGPHGPSKPGLQKEYPTGLVGGPGTHLPALDSAFPIQWIISASVQSFISAACLKELADSVGGEAGKALSAQADKVIATAIDDICPRWPWPRPPLPISVATEVAAQLVFTSNSLQAGQVRDTLKQISVQIATQLAVVVIAGQGG